MEAPDKELLKAELCEPVDDSSTIQVGEEGCPDPTDEADQALTAPILVETPVDGPVEGNDEQGGEQTVGEETVGEGTVGEDKQTTDSAEFTAGKFFVGGISPDAWHDDLLLHFQQFGKVLTVQVMCDNNTGRNRGFGFVTMAPGVALDDIFNSKHVIKNKRVEVRKMQADGASNLRRKVFIGGINRLVTEETLTNYFKAFGTIDKLTIMRDGEGASRGFGFVVFNDEDVVSQVLKKSVHQLDSLHSVDVRAAEARHKTDRRAATMRGGMPAHPPSRPPPYAPPLGPGYFPPFFPGRPPPAFLPPFAARGAPSYPPMHEMGRARGPPLNAPPMFRGPPSLLGAQRGRGRGAGGAGTDWFGLSVDGYEPQRASPGVAGVRPSYRVGPY
eukprot:GHVS01048135.1.p1 GENE.GHVS01048135.1~~GHVS01048135.1.p1  ORF type:complete len:386 (-),score=46.95 GHVS01048135.1:705-1862(-)